MADFSLDPRPLMATGNWLNPIVQGYAAVSDVQNQAARNQLAQQEMQLRQQRGQQEAAMFPGQMKNQEMNLMNNALTLWDNTKAGMTLQNYPQARQQFVNQFPQLASHFPDPSTFKNEQDFEGWKYQKEMMAARLRALAGSPKSVMPGGSLVTATGQELYKNPERVTTVLNPAGGVAATVTGPVKVLPQPQKPTLLQDETGNLVPWYPGQPTAGLSKPTVSALTETNKGQIISGLQNGQIAPSMLSKRATDYNKILAEAGKAGINMNKLESEYQGAKRFATSLNSPQMVRFQGLGKSVVNTIDELRSLSQEMQLSGLHLYNKAKLEALTKAAGNTKEGQLATRYLVTANTLKEEFANLAMGGYAPTEPAFALANSQINSNFGVQQMNSALTEVQRLINYRLNAFNELQPIVPGGQKQSGGPPQVTDANRQAYQQKMAQVQNMPDGPQKQTMLRQLQQFAQKWGL